MRNLESFSVAWNAPGCAAPTASLAMPQASTVREKLFVDQRSVRVKNALIAGFLVMFGGGACQTAADACVSAGGRCIIGPDINCARRGESCNTNPPNPGGAFCCFEFADAGDAAAEANTMDGASDAGGVCTPGKDQTCNDDPTINSIHGTCLPDRSCSCSIGPGLNPVTGKCR
jgi:hypothetical protein